MGQKNSCVKSHVGKQNSQPNLKENKCQKEAEYEGI